MRLCVFRFLTVRRRAFAVISPLAVGAFLAAAAPPAFAVTPLDGEGLSGTGTTTHGGSGGYCSSPHGVHALVYFSLSGTASGPYPGAFSETGSVSFSGASKFLGGIGLASVSAGFKITSGATTITGSFAGQFAAGAICNSALQLVGFSTFGQPNVTYTAAINGQTSQGTASVSGTFYVAAGARENISESVAVTHGQISGTVADSRTAAPLGGICVQAYNSSGGVVSSTQTDLSGAYTLSGVPAGPAEVGFSTGCGADDYLAQYYDDQPSLASADPVSVTAGATTAGINATMVQGGQIKGRVIARVTRAPLAGICVRGYNGSGGVVASAQTNWSGTYTISALPAGS